MIGNVGLLLVFILSCTQCAKIINMGQDQPINFVGFKKAVAESQRIFNRSPNMTVIIKIPAGTYNVTTPSNIVSAINVRNIRPSSGGRLIIEGTGMDETVLIVNEHNQFISGRKVYRFTLRNLALKRNRAMAGQGIVVEAGTGYVTVQMHPGFPGMDTLVDNALGGRYLRRYTYAGNNCIKEDTLVNAQLEYKNYQHLGGRTWKILLVKQNRPPYSRGDVIGIKSKCCGGGRNVYFFHTGDDIVFENIKFIRASRGTIRGGINNIRFSNIRIPKDAANWCLSTSGGGPQLGNVRETPIYNIVVENLFAEGTGDDAIGLFNVASGVVRNCDIRDSFARGVLLYKSHGVRLEDNKLTRCRVLHKDFIPCPPLCK